MGGGERRRPRARPGHCATRAAPSSAGTPTPGRCCGSGSAARSSSPRRCCSRSGRSPRSRRPTSTPLGVPGLNRRTRASATSATSCFATRWCSRCTRSPASPASSPAARCRSSAEQRTGLLALVHEKARPIALRLGRPGDLLLARHPGLRARPHRRPARRPARRSPRAFWCSRSSRTRSPSWSRSSCRSPRG